MRNNEIQNMMYDMFIDKDVITTKELLGIGLTNKDLTNLVEEGKIKRVKRGFYELVDANGLLNYSKKFFGKEEHDSGRGRLALEKCLKIDSKNSSVKVRLFLSSIFDKNFEQALEELKKLDSNEPHYVQDHNLWLYLLSFITELSNEDKEKVSNMKLEDILISDSDIDIDDLSMQNSTRTTIFNQKFSKACFYLKNSQSFKEKNLFYLVTVALLYEVMRSNNNKREHLLELINEEKYSEVESLLVKDQELRGLVGVDSIIFTIVKDLNKIFENNELPKIYSGDTFIDMIKNHDYKGALSKNNTGLLDVGNKCVQSLLNTIIEEINKLEDKKNEEQSRKRIEGKYFSNITSHLMRHDINMAIGELDDYLRQIGCSCYKDVIIDLIKLDLLNDDKAFVDTMYELSNITNEDYQFDASIYIHDFYINLVNKNFKKASVLLEIISKSGDVGGVYIDTTDMKEALNQEMKKRGVSLEELKIDMPEIKSPIVEVKPIVREVSIDVTDEDVEKFYTIPDIVDKVLKEESLVMLEPMSDDEVNKIAIMVGNIPNLQTRIFKEENGDNRIFLRYVNKYAGYINFADILRTASNNYHDGLYDDCIDKYESVITKMTNPKNYIYAKLGLSYYKKNEGDDINKAVDYLTLANLQNLEQETYNFDSLLDKLKEKSGYNGLKVNYESTDDSVKNDVVQYKK